MHASCKQKIANIRVFPAGIRIFRKSPPGSLLTFVYFGNCIPRALCYNGDSKIRKRGHNMSYKRILTVQDISCVGQCSLTVALPILSACGLETCALPSAVLSTHTGGFTGYTFRDLTDDIPGILSHWEKEAITFDAIYTGYLGSTRQIDCVSTLFRRFGGSDCVKVVDPAMADNGSLYPGFDDGYVQAMKGLCAQADIILPNLTEAALLVGGSCRDTRSIARHDYIDALLQGLRKLGCPTIVLTGVSYREGKTGVVVCDHGEYHYYEHETLPGGCHGTGDVYASAFVGSLTRGKSVMEAARIAADFTVECIRETARLADHWYGVAFEPVLGRLIQALQ